MFNLEHFKLRISDHLDFKIHTIVHGKQFHHTVIDEGASTCVMSLSCWWSIGSPDLDQSPTTLKSFDGHGFKLDRILKSLAMELGRKTISIYV